MVMITRGRGYDLGSGAGTETIDEWMWEFISSEITRGILEQTLVIFGTIKDRIMDIMYEHQYEYHTGIIEFLDERLWAFRVEIIAVQLGAQTPTF